MKLDVIFYVSEGSTKRGFTFSLLLSKFQELYYLYIKRLERKKEADWDTFRRKQGA